MDGQLHVPKRLTARPPKGHTLAPMAHRYLSFCVFALVAMLAAPSIAQAQYKNKSFGMDVSYQLISQPPITDSNNNPLPRGSRGNRLNDGIRVGGEGSFKLQHDRWWFNARLDLSFLGYGRTSAQDAKGSFEAQADYLGARAMGLNMGLDGQVGVRYYLLTDHFRPYVQAAFSYMHIFSFGANASALCSDGNLCADGTYGDNFLPRTNILAVHAAPGAEIILRRDLALHIILDYQRWLVFRGKGNNVFTMGAGLTFYG